MSQSRKRIVVIVSSVVAVLALAAVVGPIIYARSQSAAPEPLTVSGSSPSTSVSAAGSAPASSPTASADTADDGTWEVADGSEAGYRVDEVLNGQDVTVVGRTDEVSGNVEVAGNQLTEATITVDVASVATDSDRRDNYFRENAMKVSEHPTATFTLTEPVALPSLRAEATSVEAAGTLELAGTSKPVTATIEVARDGATVKAAGSVDVRFADWDITAPDLGFVKVEDTGQVEFLVQLEQ